MLRNFAILGVLIASVGIAFAGQGTPLGPPKHGIAKESKGAGAQEPGQSDGNKNSASNIAPGTNQPPAPSTNADKEQRDEDIAVQRKIANLTGWLVGVGALQAIALIGTLIVVNKQADLMREHAEHLKTLGDAAKGNTDAARETLAAIKRQGLSMKRQTTHLRASAEASLKQANHMATSERAWLVISSVYKSGSVIQPGFAPLYWWQVKNVGSTPARLIDTQARCKLGMAELPETPQYSRNPIELHERILGPGDTLDLWTLWENEDGTIFRNRLEKLESVDLRAYGYIRYKTTFSEEDCEARFCDYFNHVPKESIATDKNSWAIEFRPDLTAPAAYTKSN